MSAIGGKEVSENAALRQNQSVKGLELYFGARWLCLGLWVAALPLRCAFATATPKIFLKQAAHAMSDVTASVECRCWG